MKSLVGYTGFVGSNLDSATKFDGRYNSKNISAAFGTTPELLVYAGVPAAKYLANSFPEKDLEVIRQAEENIRKISPKKLVLISTVDVFKNPAGADENFSVGLEGLHAYGKNRRLLEIWVEENFPDALIVRLPGLFGKNLKKNFIYDFIRKIPFRLKGELFQKFLAREPGLNEYYFSRDDGFFQCKDLSAGEEKNLREIFSRLKFSALNFTDSRSVYQFYPLARLWADIELALKNNLRLWHAAVEPVSAAELYKFLAGENFSNELSGAAAQYDFRTRHAEIFGGKSPYILDKETVMKFIAEFVADEVGGDE